ncbi:MAG: hypothetical protein ABEJ55_01160 [Halanaeroarchaeum sp.]
MTRLSPPRILAVTLLLGGTYLSHVPRVQAIQSHGEPEGYVVHQLAHAFFLLALLSMLLRFHRDGRLREGGWAHVALGIGLFAGWNLLTIGTHAITAASESQLSGPYALSGSATVDLTTPAAWFAYVGNLDYVLAVPGMAFLYLGLRRLTPPSSAEDGDAG